MNAKALYLLAAGVGGTVGGFVPMLWGGSAWGGASILTSTIVALVAIWATYRYIVS